MTQILDVRVVFPRTTTLYFVMITEKNIFHVVYVNSSGALVAATREIGLEVSLIKLSTWLCLEIRMQDEVTE